MFKSTTRASSSAVATATLTAGTIGAASSSSRWLQPDSQGQQHVAMRACSPVACCSRTGLKGTVKGTEFAPKTTGELYHCSVGGACGSIAACAERLEKLCNSCGDERAGLAAQSTTCCASTFDLSAESCAETEVGWSCPGQTTTAGNASFTSGLHNGVSPSFRPQIQGRPPCGGLPPSNAPSPPCRPSLTSLGLPLSVEKVGNCCATAAAAAAAAAAAGNPLQAAGMPSVRGLAERGGPLDPGRQLSRRQRREAARREKQVYAAAQAAVAGAAQVQMAVQMMAQARPSSAGAVGQHEGGRGGPALVSPMPMANACLTPEMLAVCCQPKHRPDSSVAT